MINAKFKLCRFIAGISNIHQIPDSFQSNEVAFAGRSNVGKSSLLNILTFQKHLAKISKTPGRTQQINFFSIDNLITLVDLPGYGYSKVGQKKIRDWGKLIALYISSRENLKLLFLLIDSRRGLQAKDLAALKWLDSYSINYSIVLTKVDKVKKNELENTISNIKNARRSLNNIDIIPTSNRDNTGILKLRSIISTFMKKQNLDNALTKNKC